MPQQFTLRQGTSAELRLFPHIKEFGVRKSNAIELGSFAVTKCKTVHVYYIIDGKLEWLINQTPQILFPGDTIVVLPEQEVGGSQGYWGIGTFIYLKFYVEEINNNGMKLGHWSNLSDTECRAIGKILFMNDLSVMTVNEVAGLLNEMHSEITNQEIGYITRINYMLDSLLIVIGRQSTRQASSRKSFPQTFAKLEQELRRSLAHHWTVEEMAAMMGLGTTAFTEKVKSYTGFSPLSYLINLRISEATKMLKQHKGNITSIALETGFYSSQHFATTFKKLTGYTPGEFRKGDTSND